MYILYHYDQILSNVKNMNVIDTLKESFESDIRQLEIYRNDDCIGNFTNWILDTEDLNLSGITTEDYNLYNHVGLSEFLYDLQQFISNDDFRYRFLIPCGIMTRQNGVKMYHTTIMNRSQEYIEYKSFYSKLMDKPNFELTYIESLEEYIEYKKLMSF